MTDLSAEWVGQIVSWLLIILGWSLINRHQNDRETRKEIHERLDHLKKTVKNLETRAITYHLEENPAPLTSLKIKSTLELLWSEIAPLKLIDSDDLGELIFYLRRDITLCNFDAESHIPLSPDSRQLQEIGASSQRLLTKLDTAFISRFH